MEEPIYMLNALWLKEEGGKEKYLEYGAAANALLKKAGGEVQENYYPEKSIIGEWDPDVFFLVKYPSKAAFEAMVKSPEYQEILHLREDAIEKSLLIRCKPFDWGLDT
ncbi:DUF1330 domain-containing protein [Marinobacter adhaerens]|uniref:DUF1330 domain-containing protein n=1 Tax=Marinobacter adhaerens TaxID=1033846 RepID=A0A851HS53_9GAMM|nr:MULTISPECIES: DUF1330 domain-containing protein [Marinobacter]NWN90276.1 DUF1330 domain-containing protein [Marinobacter adhaerens]